MRDACDEACDQSWKGRARVRRHDADADKTSRNPRDGREQCRLGPAAGRRARDPKQANSCGASHVCLQVDMQVIECLVQSRSGASASAERQRQRASMQGHKHKHVMAPRTGVESSNSHRARKSAPTNRKGRQIARRAAARARHRGTEGTRVPQGDKSARTQLARQRRSFSRARAQGPPGRATRLRGGTRAGRGAPTNDGENPAQPRDTRAKRKPQTVPGRARFRRVC